MNSIVSVLAAIWSLYVLILLCFGIFYFYQPLKQMPPKPTRIAGLIESCFGVLFVLISIPIRLYEMSDVMLKIPLHIIGLGWLIMAIQLYKGNPIARTSCLIVSIIRCFTIVGLPFSAASIILLYCTKSSKAYFKANMKSKKESVDKAIGDIPEVEINSGENN